MKSFILKALKALIVYLEGNPAPDPKLFRVRELVVWADSIRLKDKELSGERKRHQVINQLISEFPGVPTRDLSYLIEIVLQETK